MRVVLLAAVLAIVSQPEGCGLGSASREVHAPYDPCAGKACGDECSLCAPDATDCGQTQELKECTVDGRCVSAISECFLGPQGPCYSLPVCGGYDPCAGKKCGDTCFVCAPGDSTCVETAEVKICSHTNGACIPDVQVCPSGPGGACFPIVDCGVFQ